MIISKFKTCLRLPKYMYAMIFMILWIYLLHLLVNIKYSHHFLYKEPISENELDTNYDVDILRPIITEEDYVITHSKNTSLMLGLNITGTFNFGEKFSDLTKLHVDCDKLMNRDKEMLQYAKRLQENMTRYSVFIFGHCPEISRLTTFNMGIQNKKCI